MTRAIRIFCIILLFSCTDDNNEGPPTVFAVKIGSSVCHKTMGEMQWLSELIQRSKTDIALRGDIYAGSLEGRVIFIHQPLVMSCLACVLYDCDGNKVDPATIDHEKLRLLLGPEDRIYKARY